jgi:hypothetical protein
MKSCDRPSKDFLMRIGDRLFPCRIAGRGCGTGWSGASGSDAGGYALVAAKRRRT